MASLSTCHMGPWLGWQILLNLDVQSFASISGFLYWTDLVCFVSHVLIVIHSSFCLCILRKYVSNFLVLCSTQEIFF